MGSVEVTLDEYVAASLLGLFINSEIIVLVEDRYREKRIRFSIDNHDYQRKIEGAVLVPHKTPAHVVAGFVMDHARFLSQCGL